MITTPTKYLDIKENRKLNRLESLRFANLQSNSALNVHSPGFAINDIYM